MHISQSKFFSCLLLLASAFSPLLQAAPAKSETAVPNPVQTLIEHYSADSNDLARIYTDPLSPTTRDRMSRFQSSWRQQLATVDFAALDRRARPTMCCWPTT